jgi:hypothetical protein
MGGVRGEGAGGCMCFSYVFIVQWGGKSWIMGLWLGVVAL